MFRVIPLTKDDKLCWALLPFVVERAKAFANKYDSYAKPDELAKIIEFNFVTGNPTVLSVAITKKGKGVIGHAIASADSYLGTTMLTIMQYEMDEPLEPRELYNQGWEAILAWGRSKGATVVQGFALDEARAERFKKFGLKRSHIVLRCDLGEA